MDYTFFSLETETTKFPILHSKPYPAFFTPRNKKPSHSSSEKTSSEFDLLEIKITRKQKYEGKAEQVLYRYISYYDSPLVGLHIFFYIGSEIYIEDIF